MDEKEIAVLAARSARAIKDTFALDGRQLDTAGEDIIREYIQADLQNWQDGKKITRESSTEIDSKRGAEAKIPAASMPAIKV